MNYRDALLFAPGDLAEAGTKVIDIDLDQIISRIDIRFKTTKATQGMSLPSPANIAKIELVDGSRVLHSLSGYESQALAYYSRPGAVMDHGQHINGLSETDLYAIDFGRYLWDPLLAFDPTKFRNPQLKITWDEDLSDTSVSANELEVRAKIFDEKQVVPEGFLRAIEEIAYTGGANNSYETIKLAEDKVIRQILVRGYQDGYEPWYNLAEVRLDENNLQRIPFEFTNLEDYYRMMKAQWPLITLTVAVAPLTTGNIYYFPMTDYYAGIVLIGLGGAETAYINAASARGGKYALISSSNNNQLGLAHGYLPWHCVQFPMGLQDDIEDWYDPMGKSPKLRLRVASGGTGCDVAVVLEQLERY